MNVCVGDDVIQLQLKDIFQFMSGADCIPPLGFQRNMSLIFYDQENNMTSLPYVSTCALQLALTRGHKDESSFSELMGKAIFGSFGFGKASGYRHFCCFNHISVCHIEHAIQCTMQIVI